MPDGVLFVERSGELCILARLRDEVPEPQGNQALIGRSDTLKGIKQSVQADPKPGDLPMSRMKLS